VGVQAVDNVLKYGW